MGRGAQERVITESVKDFRPLLEEGYGAGVLLTSSRHFPRSRGNLGLLLDEINRWLNAAAANSRP